MTRDRQNAGKWPTRVAPTVATSPRHLLYSRRTHTYAHALQSKEPCIKNVCAATLAQNCCLVLRGYAATHTLAKRRRAAKTLTTKGNVSAAPIARCCRRCCFVVVAFCLSLKKSGYRFLPLCAFAAVCLALNTHTHRYTATHRRGT